MNSKNTKITVDILMTVFLVLSFVRWQGSHFAFHAVVGVACTLLFATHIFIHRKWLKAVTVSCFTGKFNKTLKWKYLVDVLLLGFWGISIVTGFVAVAPFLGEAGGGLWGRIHGLTARIGLGLIIIHIIQHLPQIKSYLGIKKQAQS